VGESPAPLAVRFGVIGNPKLYDWYRKWVQEAESAGFELITSGDSQSLWADPFVSLGVAAVSTARPRLGITVSNPRTRHPAVTAAGLASLDALAPGRIVYGVSSGDSALRNLRLPPASVEEVRRYAVAVKSLCAGGTVDWNGASIKVEWAEFDIPVWIAAEAPRRPDRRRCLVEQRARP
jgi:5,10-methylenetetrahydromethanopterin reductase